MMKYGRIIRVSTELLEDSPRPLGPSFDETLCFVLSQDIAVRSAKRRKWLKQGFRPTAYWYTSNDDWVEALQKRPPTRKAARGADDHND